MRIRRVAGRFRGIRRRPWALAVLILATVPFVTHVVNAAIPDSTTGQITACFKIFGGELRIIDAEPPPGGEGEKCKPSEQQLTWKTTGNITSADIVNGTIATVDLANNAVTSAKIADGTIANADLGPDAVTTDKILDGTIANADLGPDAVTTDKILDGTIVGADVADHSLSLVKLAGRVATLSFNLPNIAGNTCDVFPFAFPGSGIDILPGDKAFVQSPDGLNAGLIAMASELDAAETYKLRICNITANPIDDGQRVFTIVNLR